MNLESLDTIFTKRLFRIPDYQRGYAWRAGKGGREVIDFWEDLLNLNSSRKHYTGVLTLEKMEATDESIKDEWLLEEDFCPVHVVDGQQRLTTAVILINSFCEFYRKLNPDKNPSEIYMGKTHRLSDIEEKYIHKVMPGGVLDSFIFGYEKGNPSDTFLKSTIFGQPVSEQAQETFYTLNLANAKNFFDNNIAIYFESNDNKIEKVDELFKKLTLKMVFNVFQIDSSTGDFDIFVAFETMNNRGKSLSNLELLKNRLIYLTTLLPDSNAVKKSVRDDINNSWKVVYEWLGKNKEHPLNDDDFLFTHWVLKFPYSRKDGSDYIRFLLDTKFTTKNICENTVKVDDGDDEDANAEVLARIDEDSDYDTADVEPISSANKLTAAYLKDYVISLKDTVIKWYDTWFPDQNTTLSDDERKWLDRLNRIGISYFRPLITAALLSQGTEKEKVSLFKTIERFIFVVFRTQNTRSNYRSSEFYGDARRLLNGELSFQQIIDDLKERMGYSFTKEGDDIFFNFKEFHSMINRKFNEEGSGYYGWGCRWYFLYEYEMELAQNNSNRRVVCTWNQFFKAANGRITIEHIYPQTPDNSYWKEKFADIPEDQQKYYQGSIGNLLLLSQSINSSLQNDGFDDKKKRKEDSDKNILRLGYENGSFSEVEVAKKDSWTPEAIKERGMDLMRFMVKRWDLPIKDESVLSSMLFLPDNSMPSQGEFQDVNTGDKG